MPQRNTLHPDTSSIYALISKHAKYIFQNDTVNFPLEPKCPILTTIYSPSDVKPSPLSSNIHY